MAKNEPAPAARSSGAIEAEIVSTQERLATATARFSTLTEARPALLVDGSDSDLEAHDADMVSARREIDRASAIASRQAAELATALATEQDAARLALYAEALKATASLKGIPDDYAKGVDLIRGVLRKLATAEIAVAAANAALPQGKPPLDEPERAVRVRPSRPRQDLSRVRVDLWINSYNGQPYPDEIQAKIKVADDGLGYIPPSDHGAGLREIRRRSFERVTFLPADPRTYLQPLGQTVALPAFEHGRGDPWVVDNRISLSAAEILRMLDAADPAARVSRPDPKPAPQTEIVPVEDHSPPPVAKPLLRVHKGLSFGGSAS